MTISELPQTSPDLTPGQQRTAKARAARAAQANERKAAQLRAAGFIVVPERSIPAVLAPLRGDGAPDLSWERGFRAGVTAVCEVSGALDRA